MQKRLSELLDKWERTGDTKLTGQDLDDAFSMLETLYRLSFPLTQWAKNPTSSGATYQALKAARRLNQEQEN